MIGDPSDRNPHEHASSPQVPSGYRILTQAGRPNANKPATYILGRLPVVGGAGPDRAKQTLSGTAAVPAGVAADGGFPSTYATRCRPGHGQTPPTSAHSARVPALADSGEHGELWTTGPVVRGWRTGTLSARGWRPAPSPRCPRGRRAGAPAMPRRRRPGRAEAGVRPRALLPALLGRAGCRASPRFVGGSGIRPVDCRSGGCGFESRPPRFRNGLGASPGPFSLQRGASRTTRPILSPDTPSQQRKPHGPRKGKPCGLGEKTPFAPNPMPPVDRAPPGAPRLSDAGVCLVSPG